MYLITPSREFGVIFFFAAIQSLVAQPYVITTVAGGAPPPSPIAAVSASLPLPSGVTADSVGNVYLSSDNCVFRVDSTGTLTRIAGTSRAGFSGDGGPATSAQLNGPYGLAVDKSGNLY